MTPEVKKVKKKCYYCGGRGYNVGFKCMPLKCYTCYGKGYKMVEEKILPTPPTDKP